MSNQKPYSACLMGAALDTGNSGVSALATSLAQLVLEMRPAAAISLFIGNRSSLPQGIHVGGRNIQVRIENYRLSPRASVRKHLFWILLMACLYRLLPFERTRAIFLNAAPALRCVKEADFIGCIRGGDSFTDLYGVKRFIIGSIPTLIALLVRQDLALLPQTYGPFRSSVSRRVARFIVARSKTVLSRDREGLTVVRDLLAGDRGGRDVRFCPDVAFILDERLPEEPEIHPALPDERRRPLIGLNVSGLLYNGGYTGKNMFRLNLDYRHFVRKLAERFLEETDADILFVPHTYAPEGHVENDQGACREIFQLLHDPYIERVHLVTGRYDAQELKGIISLCDFFIGSRMHACIAALSQGIPTVGVAYSRKFHGVFSSVGAGDLVVDARSTGSEEAVRDIVRRFKDREDLKPALKENIEGVTELLLTTFHDLLNSPSFRLTSSPAVKRSGSFSMP